MCQCSLDKHYFRVKKYHREFWHLLLSTHIVKMLARYTFYVIHKVHCVQFVTTRSIVPSLLLSNDTIVVVIAR